MKRRNLHSLLTVFAELMTERVLFAKSGEAAWVCAAFAAELLRHNAHPKASQHVGVDMGAAFVRGIVIFGNARVVYEKFHVIQNVVEACNQVRNVESWIREAGSVGADALDVAEEPGKLSGKSNPAMGFDGPKTMFDGHGSPDEAWA